MGARAVPRVTVASSATPNAKMGSGYLQRLVKNLQLNAGQLGLIFGVYLVPGAVGQYEHEHNIFSYNVYDCDKYCFASCLGMPREEFSACVSANVHCNCVTKISRNNPFALFAAIAGILIMISICSMCYRCCRDNSTDPRRLHSIVAAPVTGQSGNGAHIIANSNTRANNSRSSQTSPRPFIIPLGGSQKSNDLPPEYLPPPAYNECVVNVDPPGAQKV